MTMSASEPKSGGITGAFASADRRTVVALFEAILPGRPDAPGASDADAASYLDRLLSTGEYREVPRWRELYAELIPVLRKAGADTDPARVLLDLAAGAVPGWPPDTVEQRRFLTLLRDHCVEGCFADPRWGGNKNGVMWRWFGYLQPAQGGWTLGAR